MGKAIIVEKISKNYEVTKKEPGLAGAFRQLISPNKKTIKALREISFSIEEGELVGFIGPNGAGKTTTLKILSGLLYPTSGFTSVLGYNPWDRKPEFLKQISLVMGQKNQLWWDLPAQETFELNKAIYEIPEKKFRENLLELTRMLNVEKIMDVPVRRLSLGQRMKLELVAALIHKPKILFLDEPTIGLDLIAQQKLRDFIYDYNKTTGSTIILTSHNMSDLVNLARRVIVVDKGRLIFDGAFEDLQNKFAKEKIIKAYFSGDVDEDKLEKIGKVKKFSFPEVSLSVNRQVTAVAAAELLQNFPVADLTIEEIPIEEIIRKVFKGDYKISKK